MFSRRLPTHLQPSGWALAVEQARRDPMLLDLTVSNPHRAAIEMHSSEILQAFVDPRILTYDPLPGGMPSARAAIAAHYQTTYNVTVAPEQVFVTASTSESYSHLFALLADAGDEVLVPRPSYPLFDTLAQLSAVTVAQYALEFDGTWAMNVRAMSASLTDKTRAIVVVSPNNPTGNLMRLGEHAELATMCRENNIALIVDEVFAEYLFAPNSDRVQTVAGDSRGLTFALGGLSKSAALPQIKLGWIVVSGPEPLRTEAIERLEHINDAYLSAGAPAQCAVAVLMAQSAPVRERINQRIRENYQMIVAVLAEHFHAGITALPCDGGWTVVLRVPLVVDENEWVLGLLRDDRVLVQPGYFYDFEREGYLVLSLLTPPNALREGLRKIVDRAVLLLA